MAVSGLVVTLDSRSALADNAIAQISMDARLVIGDRFGSRLAVVAETPGVADDRELWDDLHAIAGVVHVDVTFVALDDTSLGAAESPQEKCE